MHGFSTAWGSAPLTPPALLKGQLHTSEHEDSHEGKERRLDYKFLFCPKGNDSSCLLNLVPDKVPNISLKLIFIIPCG